MNVPEAAKNKHDAEGEAGRRGAYMVVREHRTASLTKSGAVLQRPPSRSSRISINYKQLRTVKLFNLELLKEVTEWNLSVNVLTGCSKIYERQS